MKEEADLKLLLETPHCGERPWAKRLGPKKARVMNVPYFDDHGVHGGDIVEIKRLSPWKRQAGRPYRVVRVLERSLPLRACVVARPSKHELLTATHRLDIGMTFAGEEGYFEWATDSVGFGCLDPDAWEGDGDPVSAALAYFESAGLEGRIFWMKRTLSEQELAGPCPVYPFKDMVAIMHEWREVFELS